MKTFIAMGEKIFRVHKAFHPESKSHTDLRTSQRQLSGKGCQYREEDSENKILS